MTKRFMTKPAPERMSATESTARERMLGHGWTVARHPWTGLVTDLATSQVLHAAELDPYGPDNAREFGALYTGSGPVRWKELIHEVRADEARQWSLAAGRNVTAQSIKQMRRAGLTPEDAREWFTTTTLAAHLRLVNVLDFHQYRDQPRVYHFKQDADGRHEQSWATFIARHHRAGHSAVDLLGWGWDTPVWLLDALAGKAVNATKVQMHAEMFLLLAGAMSHQDEAPQDVQAYIAREICALDEFRRRWLHERLGDRFTWQEAAYALYRFDEVWLPSKA